MLRVVWQIKSIKMGAEGGGIGGCDGYTNSSRTHYGH